MNRYELPENGFASKSDEKLFWQRVIKGYRGSKLSRIEFCERYGLKLSSFKRWVSHVNREALKSEVESAGLNFIQAKVGEAKEVAGKDGISKDNKFEIELTSGDKLKLPLDKNLLIMAINLLRR